MIEALIGFAAIFGLALLRVALAFSMAGPEESMDVTCPAPPAKAAKAKPPTWENTSSTRAPRAISSTR